MVVTAFMRAPVLMVVEALDSEDSCGSGDSGSGAYGDGSGGGAVGGGSGGGSDGGGGRVFLVA